MLKKLKRSKKIIVMLTSVLVFGAAVYYVFFLMTSPNPVDPTAVSASANSSYQEYKDYISNTKNGIKVLLEGEQLGQISIHPLPEEESGSERNTNPFMKSF